MIRPVLLHGNDEGRLLTLASELAVRLSARVIDLRGEVGPVGSVAFGGVTDCVGVISRELILDRVRRVEELARSTVVALNWPGAGTGLHGGSAQALDGLVRGEFREAHICLDVGHDERDVLEAIVEVVERNSVAVAAREQSYLVDVGRDLVSRELPGSVVGASGVLYLTDANVDRLHGKKLGSAVSGLAKNLVKHVLVPGEEQKRLGTLGEIFDSALAGGIDRSGWLVAAGGGVTTDIGGLVAALWMRGLRWIGVPTTLLAMVDASVGGKTAVDHGRGKNAVGAFWQPSRVLCDVEFLQTEADRNYLGGLAEVVKTALIGDPVLFGMLKEHRASILARDVEVLAEVVRRCVQVKARIVGLDERESGIRAVLNLGHTMGHALEALGDYRRYTHGEAVSIGTVAALGLGMRLGVTPRELAEEVEELLGELGLPVRVANEEMRSAAELVGHDKKRAGKNIRFVLARGIGDVGTEQIGIEELRRLVADVYA